jgi:ABC-type multidrug transport system fused ATPase/permease subunit
MSAPTSGARRRAGVRKRLRRTWSMAGPFIALSPKPIALLALCSVLAAACEAGILTLLVQVGIALSSGDQTVDKELPFTGHTIELTPGEMLGIGFGLAVIRLLLQLVEAYLPARMSSQVEVTMRTAAYDAFVDADWETQSKEREGQLPTVLSNEVTLAATAMQQVSLAISAFLSFTALLLVSLAVSPAATGTIAVSCLILFFLLRPLGRLTRALSGERLEAFRSFSTFVNESVRLAEEMQVFGSGKELKERAAEVTATVEKPNFSTRFYSQLVPSLYRNVALILVIVGLSVVHGLGGNALSSLGATVLILIRALIYGQSFQAVYNRLSEVAPYMQRVNDTIAHYRERRRATGDEVLGRIESIHFDDVSFGYVSERPVVRELTLDIEPGEVIGVVGRSGAGKSTFVQLLLRLRDPDGGRYLVNGRDALDYDLDSWKAGFAYVPQETQVVEDTVAENIRFYRPDVTREDIERAAQRAHLHDDVLAMPEGYDTKISQRAEALSGGQRQRLCLARALVRGPQVLVLDEPTSALDAKSEALVTKTLQELHGDVTLVIVAHRMSTLEICDRIMVISDGRLQSFGAPSELRATDAFYQEALTLSGLH